MAELAIEQPTVIPPKVGIQLLLYALAFAVAFKSVPISAASQSGVCLGEMAMDGHFSFDAQGRASKRP